MANSIVADPEITLPDGILRFGLGETIGNGQRSRKAVQCGRMVVLCKKQLTEPLMAEAEAALPIGVCRIGFGEPISDGE
jgi:hypothetical protein